MLIKYWRVEQLIRGLVTSTWANNIGPFGVASSDFGRGGSK